MASQSLGATLSAVMCGGALELLLLATACHNKMLRACAFEAGMAFFPIDKKGSVLFQLQMYWCVMICSSLLHIMNYEYTLSKLAYICIFIVN